MGHGLGRLAGLVLVGAIAIAATMTSALAMSPATDAGAAAKPAKSMLSYVTLYGFVDNSPPSAIISNPQIHQQAGGTGTFADPETFATDVREFKPGTILYYSFLKKYFIMEDTCVECTADWDGNGGNGDNPTPVVNGRQFRVDLWAGGDKRSLKDPQKTALLDCEDALTQPNGGTIQINPPGNLPVDTTPVFNVKNNRCQKPG